MIPIFNGLVALGQTWLTNRAAKAKAQNEQEVTLIKQTGSWEELHAKGSQDSWKDEFWTIIFAIPLVLCFIPETVDVVMEGFKVLENTPEWYRYAIGILVGASVGIRSFNKLKPK